MNPLVILAILGFGILWLTGDSGTPTCAPHADADLPILGSQYGRPLATYTVTSKFGDRVLDGHTQFHPGVDLAAPEGSPIFAVIGGKVVRTDTAGVGPGIDNGNATAILGTDGIVWSYLHQSCRAAGIVPGATLDRGRFLGCVGMTGNATGPHLHLQASLSGVPMDPMQILFLNRSAPTRT